MLMYRAKEIGGLPLAIHITWRSKKANCCVRNDEEDLDVGAWFFER